MGDGTIDPGTVKNVFDIFTMTFVSRVEPNFPGHLVMLGHET